MRMNTTESASKSDGKSAGFTRADNVFVYDQRGALDSRASSRQQRTNWPEEKQTEATVVTQHLQAVVEANGTLLGVSNRSTPNSIKSQVSIPMSLIALHQQSSPSVYYTPHMAIAGPALQQLQQQQQQQLFQDRLTTSSTVSAYNALYANLAVSQPEGASSATFASRIDVLQKPLDRQVRINLASSSSPRLHNGSPQTIGMGVGSKGNGYGEISVSPTARTKLVVESETSKHIAGGVLLLDNVKKRIADKSSEKMIWQPDVHMTAKRRLLSEDKAFQQLPEDEDITMRASSSVHHFSTARLPPQPVQRLPDFSGPQGYGLNGGASHHVSATPSVPSVAERRAAQPHYPAHFHKGSLIQLATGVVKKVEELRTEDFMASANVSTDLKIDSCVVVHMEPVPHRDTVMLGFSIGEQRFQVTVEATLEHPFFVYSRGWSSCNPQRTYNHYGLRCDQLAVGDVCVSLTNKLPSVTTVVEQQTNTFVNAAADEKFCGLVTDTNSNGYYNSLRNSSLQNYISSPQLVAGSMQTATVPASLQREVVTDEQAITYQRLLASTKYDHGNNLNQNFLANRCQPKESSSIMIPRNGQIKQEVNEDALNRWTDVIESRTRKRSRSAPDLHEEETYSEHKSERNG